MDINLASGFFLAIILGGIVKVYKSNLDRKNHVIDRKRIGRITRLNIKDIPLKDVKLKYSNSIEHFNNVIKDKLPYVSLDYFYRNINNLLINEKNFLMEQQLGEYDIINNIIRLLPNDEGNLINHESLHLSSSIYDGKIAFSGFRQVSDEFDIGED